MSKPTAEPHNFALSGIPNDRAGRAVVAAIRKHLNRDRFQLRVRGNGPRTEAAKKARKKGESARGNFHQDLPAKYAKTFRIYFDNKAGRRYFWDRVSAAKAQTDDTVSALQVERDNTARHLEDLAQAQHREAELLRTIAVIRGSAAAEIIEQKNSAEQAVLELSAAVHILARDARTDDPARIAALAIVAKWGRS